MNKFLYATRQYIDAYKKIGTKDLIVEAEKSYLYNQFDLSQEICEEIIFHPNEYPFEVVARANELAVLIHYYHSSETSTKLFGDKEAYERLAELDKCQCEIYDSRLILGDYYVKQRRYEDAMKSYGMFYINRNNNVGLKALSDMYKRGQYDTDTLYEELVERYKEFYKGINVRDALIKSAKADEEYFASFICKSVCERIGVSCRELPHQYYSDDDFVLPFVLREYNCADEIRFYARNSQKPTLEGCMLYLSYPEIRLIIEQKTIQAINKEYKDALIRNHLQNERLLLEMQKQDIENRSNHYRELRRQMEEYQNRSLQCQAKSQEDAAWYQRQALRNQEEAMKQAKAYNNKLDWKLQQIVWNTNRIGRMY